MFLGQTIMLNALVVFDSQGLAPPSEEPMEGT